MQSFEWHARHISIHAPLTGSDIPPPIQLKIDLNFNPRSPSGERRVTFGARLQTNRFQSTLPLRGATGAAHDAYAALCISIHAPLTGSDLNRETLKPQDLISIHAPLTGSDLRKATVRRVTGDFNPRSPYGERLCTCTKCGASFEFQSTLPLRGATAALLFYHDLVKYFNPRSPYGERHYL